MSEMQVKLCRLRDGAKLPIYATEGAAACDLSSAEASDVVILPGARALIHTGLAIEPESTDAVAIIAGRSGLGAKYGVTLSNCIGVIDSDYRGELMVSLVNHGAEPYTVHPGDRVAQLFFLPVIHARFLACEALGDTARSTGGFGSTGQ